MSRFELVILAANAAIAIALSIIFYLRTRGTGISPHWYFVFAAGCLISLGGVLGWLQGSGVFLIGNFHAVFQLLTVICLTAGLYLLYDSEKKRERELRGLHEMGQLLVSIRDPNALARRMLEILRETVEVKACAVIVVDPKTDGLRIAAAESISEDCQAARSETAEYPAFREALDTKQPVQVTDALTGDTPGRLTIAGECGSYFAIPMVTGDRSVGLFALYRPLPSSLSHRELQFLTTLAPEAAIAIENAKLYKEVHDKAEVMSTMVQEMHHRIKNNLQAIASLLSLEMLEGSSITPQECIRHSIARVKSIAAVHELISLDNSGIADIKNLAERIVDVESRSLRHNGRQVYAEVLGPNIFLPSNRATAFALVLNELVSNSIQHGLAETEQGKVIVSLEDLAEQVVLTVSDNGSGLPQDFAPRGHGLGLQIADTLVHKDLCGTLALSSGDGTIATVVFPK